MHSYVFKAKDGQGTLISGSLSADRRKTAVIGLKRKGYYLISVQLQSRLLGLLGGNWRLGRGVGIKERAIFTHQLATLLGAGVLLTTALKTLSRQTPNKYFASVILQLHNDVEQSCSLSEAMAKHRRVFSRVYTAIVEAAEQSGSLGEALSVLGKQLKDQAAVNSRIRGALAYPVFLLVVGAAVVAVLTRFVVPKFIELFAGEKQQLPLPTRVLVATTEFVEEFWWVGVPVIVGVVCLVLWALKNERGRLFIDTMLLRLPILGTLNRKLQQARFARTLGSLLKGGVKITSAVKIAGQTTTNNAFAREIDSIEQKVLAGATVAGAMAQQTQFTEVMANMAAVGEQSGTLAEMLHEVARLYDRECESAINTMTSLLGPAMIVVLGLITGFVVTAILMPIFETSTLIH